MNFISPVCVFAGCDYILCTRTTLAQPSPLS